VELPVKFSGARPTTIRLDMDIATVLDDGAVLNEAISTHSRAGDPLALKLKERVARAFRVQSVRSDIYQPVDSLQPLARSRPTNGTPHRLSISERLPKVELPADNPLTVEGVELGRRLFHDAKLSRNDRQSCATCHDHARAFTDGQAYSLGESGQRGRRNAMPLSNLAWAKEFFWDGRAKSLREQVLLPIQDAHEMNETLERVVAKLEADREYQGRFQAAFGPLEKPVEKESAGKKGSATVPVAAIGVSPMAPGAQPLQESAVLPDARTGRRDAGQSARGARASHEPWVRSPGFSPPDDARPAKAGTTNFARARFMVPMRDSGIVEAPHDQSGSTITAERIALALEQFLLTLVSQESKFDQAARKLATLTAQEQRGLQLFVTEHDPARGLRGADCFHCHGGNLFSNHQFMNNGLPPRAGDVGRMEVTKSEADRGKFKVPSLRNVALTAPYMHNGVYRTLSDVVRFYNVGGGRGLGIVLPNQTLPFDQLGLSEHEQMAIVAFLRALTNEQPRMTPHVR